MQLARVIALTTLAVPIQEQTSIGGRVESKRVFPPVKQVVEEVRFYRQANQERIMRELREFLSIPNVASDTANMQKKFHNFHEKIPTHAV